MIETKFKNTELGPIPEDWKMGTFADFLDYFSAGATPYRGNPSNFVGNIPWISSGELNYNRIIDTNEYISEEGKRSAHLTLHQKGTFLIAITGLEAAGTRGRCAFIETPATTNQSCLAIKSTYKLSVEYLFWYYRLWSDYLAFNFSQGSKQQSFTADIVRKLPLYAPALTEQLKIAEALTDVDALIAELTALIEKKRSVLKGTMQELLTARRRLPGFSESWISKTFEEIGVLIRGVSFTPEECYHTLLEDTIPLFRANNVQNNHIVKDGLVYVASHRVSEKQLIKHNDILICSANGSKRLVGKSAIVCEGSKYTFGAFMMILRLFNPSFAKYCSYFMQTQEYRTQIDDLLCGSAINNLNSKQLYTIKMSYPSATAEQQAIAEILSDMDAEIVELESKRDKYKAVRLGMMQQLLTGKIRLI